MARRFDRLTKEQRDELLSAYLDNQMDAEDCARLETQLAADPTLRVELEALRHTVALVRDLPPQPIPRNFILPRTAAVSPRPAPVTRPQRRWLAPFLTAATTAVSLLFVAVLAGDLFFSGAGGMTQLAAPVVEKERVVSESLPGEGTNGADAVEESPADVSPILGGEETGVPNAAVPPEPSVSLTPQPEMPGEAKEGDDEGESGLDLTPEAEGSPVPSATEGSPIPPTGGGGEPPTESPTSTPTSDKAADTAVSTSTPVPEAASVESTPLPPTAGPAEQSLRNTEPPPDYGAETELPRPTGGEDEDWGEPAFSVWEMPWRVIEVVLGVAALLLALAMVWAWRARRR